ncbi:MAG: hypothetical protein RL497_612 [Pseudomonadota bacterium]|jgi:predicted Zn-dependent protease
MHLRAFGILLFGLYFAAPALCENQFHRDRIIDANRIEASYNASEHLIRSPITNDYLEKLIKRITASEPLAANLFRIKIMDNALPYIYCLDNGAIYLSTGLMGRLQNESQLAGLLASEMAVVFRQDADSKNDLREKLYAPKRAIPNILAVVFTGGLAAIPIVAMDEKKNKILADQLQSDSDKLAIQWLRKAGFDTRQAPLAATRLIHTLTTENQFGTTTLSNVTALTRRRTELEAAITGGADSELKPVDAETFKKLTRLYGMDLARDAMSVADKAQFNTILNRVELETGADGNTQFLRAEYIRKTALNNEQVAQAIPAYEEAIRLKNAPAEASRELGLLYRQMKNNLAAKKHLTSYLQLNPSAADAPIIKLYLESL